MCLGTHLLDHLVAEDGVFGEHLQRKEAARVGVDGELDFGERASANCAPHCILAHLAHPSLQQFHCTHTNNYEIGASSPTNHGNDDDRPGKPRKNEG